MRCDVKTFKDRTRAWWRARPFCSIQRIRAYCLKEGRALWCTKTGSRAFCVREPDSSCQAQSRKLKSCIVWLTCSELLISLIGGSQAHFKSRPGGVDVKVNPLTFFLCSTCHRHYFRCPTCHRLAGILTMWKVRICYLTLCYIRDDTTLITKH